LTARRTSVGEPPPQTDKNDKTILHSKQATE